MGLTFDESLSFDCHIKNLIKRLSRPVGKLGILDCTIFSKHLQYDLITWSSTFETNLKKLSTLQNIAVKTLKGGLEVINIIIDQTMVFFEKVLFVF